MFDALSKAQRERRKLEEQFSGLIGEAEKKKDYEERDGLVSELLMERDLIEDRINRIETDRVQKEAEKFGIPVPSLSDKESWDEDSQSHTIFLNVSTRLRLRQEIRKERRARWEDTTIWMDRIVLPLIGLIGAVTGLVSVLKSK